MHISRVIFIALTSSLSVAAAAFAQSPAGSAYEGKPSLGGASPGEIRVHANRSTGEGLKVLAPASGERIISPHNVSRDAIDTSHLNVGAGEPSRPNEIGNAR